MKKLIYFGLIILLISPILNTKLKAQTNETIRTGRPGQAIGPFTVGKNILQIQSGFENNRTEQIGYNTNSIINNNVIRFGITELFEISSVVDFQTDDFKNSINPSSQSGISGIQAGFRYNVNDKADGIIPAFGIQTRFKLPITSDDYKITNTAPVIIFVTGHSLPWNAGLQTNWVIAYNGNNSSPNYKYVVNYSFSINDKWSSFIESYGNLNSGNSTLNVDGGFAYLATKDLQFDISGGGGKNSGLLEYFVSTGISWRTNFSKKIESID